MRLSVGDVFAGYTIVRPLGIGGMGEVYLAQHPRLPRQDALKLLRSEISSDPSFRIRFTREADSIAALDHPNIVKVYDRDQEGEQLWIATQYIDGTDVAQLLRQRYPAGMPAQEAIDIIGAVAEGLDYAHGRGLVHRDVKPANVLLTQPGPGGNRRAYLADFGIARSLAEPGSLTATSLALGTVEYAAPEQLLGQPIDGRADQYALAATCYHMLTGSPVFSQANAIAAMNAHINSAPPDLARSRPDLAALAPVLTKALAKAPADRYRSCGDFALALRTAAMTAAQPEAAAPTMAATTPARPQVAVRSNSAGSKLIWAAIAATALALAATALAMNHRQSSRESEAQSTAGSPGVLAQSPQPSTVTQTAVETMTKTKTVMPPAPASVIPGVIVGTCGGSPETGFKEGACGMQQRSGPYTEAPRLVPDSLQDGDRVSIVCYTDGDVRQSDSGVSRSWYRITNGAYLPMVYVSTADPTDIPPC